MLERIAFAVSQTVRTNRVTTHQARWPSLAKAITRHDVRSGKDGCAVVFALMREPARRADNVLHVTCAALDIDGGTTPPPPPQVAVARLQALGVAASVWTTHSHKPDAPRYRIVVPLATPMQPGALRWAQAALAQALELEADPACTDPARAYYTASCSPADEQHAFAWWTDGPGLDVAPFEAEAAAHARRQEAEKLRRAAMPVRKDGKVLERAHRAIVGAGTGGRNAALNRWAFITARAAAAGEVAPHEAEHVLLDAALAAGLGHREAAYTISRGLRQGGAA